MPLFKSKTAKVEQTTLATAPLLLTSEKIRLLKSPTFGGERNESFNKFYRNIELQLIDETNATKFELMLQRLHGAAADALIQIMTQNEATNFEEIIKAMKVRFPEPNSITLQVLRRRKQQPYESLESFAETIKELVNRFYTNSRGYNKQARDFQMIKHFLCNVQSPIKQQLRKTRRNYKDLSDVLVQAKEIHQRNQVPRMTEQMSNLQLQDRHQQQRRGHMQQRFDPYPREQQRPQQRRNNWQGRQ